MPKSNSRRQKSNLIPIGSPDRSSIQRQEIDCFSSEFEGVIPDGDTSVIVNELDTSAIVDPNKLKVIGYENGKDSILVPENELKQNDGLSPSSNFEEEDFDTDNLNINCQLGENNLVNSEVVQLNS